MKVLIAGSRDIVPEEWKDIVWDSIFQLRFDNLINLELVTGCAPGADQIPYIIIDEANKMQHGQDFYSIKEFPANWKKEGKAAGYIRNKKMADYCDAAILVWDGASKGTSHMLNLLMFKRKPFILHTVPQKNEESFYQLEAR